jgi:hypothetical protein
MSLISSVTDEAVKLARRRLVSSGSIERMWVSL